jgi:hypothetical protein
LTQVDLSAWGGTSHYDRRVCRLVETQEEAATTRLVDDLNEQAMLEQILDDYKPPYPTNTAHRHYLLSSPFRYPPLAHGSRFGGRSENSFFYASEQTETCLAEAAYYRFVFFSAMTEPYPDKVVSEHQLFFVQAASEHAADLAAINDSHVQTMLQHPYDYSGTQAWGSALRKQGVTLIRYYSARCKSGTNVAITTPQAIQSTAPENLTNVQCETVPSEEIIRFALPRQFPFSFSQSEFLIEGKLPWPAA